MTMIRALAVGLACMLAQRSCLRARRRRCGELSQPDRAADRAVPARRPADVIARFVGQKLSEDWGQTVVVENRPGGNTAIAAQQVARSAPDGYTLLIPMDTTMVLNPLTIQNLPYEPLRTSPRSAC